MRIKIIQENPIVGDIENNKKKLFFECHKASKENVELIVFSELFLTGYPPQDLLCFDSFYSHVDNAIQDICNESKLVPELAILVGCPIKNSKYHIYNAAIIILNGEIVFRQNKTNLPTPHPPYQSRF